MNILVAGAAGAVGNKLVQELADNGHTVTGLVHSEDKIAKVEAAGGKAVLADVTDKSTLQDPVSGADAVVFAAGSGGKAVEAVDRDGAINLVDVAKQNGVDRFVMLSSMASGEPDKGPDELHDYLIAKGKADDYLKSSGLRHAIVRPGSLTDDGGTGRVQVGNASDLDSGEIARADVAKTLAACVEQDFGQDVAFDVVSGEQPIGEAIASRRG